MPRATRLRARAEGRLSSPPRSLRKAVTPPRMQWSRSLAASCAGARRLEIVARISAWRRRRGARAALQGSSARSPPRTPQTASASTLVSRRARKSRERSRPVIRAAAVLPPRMPAQRDIQHCVGDRAPAAAARVRLEVRRLRRGVRSTNVSALGTGGRQNSASSTATIRGPGRSRSRAEGFGLRGHAARSAPGRPWRAPALRLPPRGRGARRVGGAPWRPVTRGRPATGPRRSGASST